MERTVKYYQTIQVGLAAVEIKSKPQRQVQRSSIFKGASLLIALIALCLGGVNISLGLLEVLESCD